jgi:hypothetical protein
MSDLAHDFLTAKQISAELIAEKLANWERDWIERANRDLRTFRTDVEAAINPEGQANA